MLKRISAKMKIPFLSLVSAVALMVAAYSSSACYLLVVHQRKCPESLIKID